MLVSFYAPKCAIMHKRCTNDASYRDFSEKVPITLGHHISVLVHHAAVVTKRGVAGIRRLSFGLLGFFLEMEVVEKKRWNVVYLLRDSYDLGLKSIPFDSSPQGAQVLRDTHQSKSSQFSSIPNLLLFWFLEFFKWLATFCLATFITCFSLLLEFAVGLFSLSFISMLFFFTKNYTSVMR